MLEGIQVNPFLLLSRDSGSLRAGGGRRAALVGSTFHLSNRSGETLTRLTAAQGLCSMEQQIGSIVFFFFLFSLSVKLEGYGGGGQLGMRGKGLDPAWYGTKAKGCVRKPPAPRLEREPKLPSTEAAGCASVVGL